MKNGISQNGISQSKSTELSETLRITGSKEYQLPYGTTKVKAVLIAATAAFIPPVGGSGSNTDIAVDEGVTITDSVHISFSTGGGGNPPTPQIAYPMSVKFEGVNDPVQADENGIVMVPAGFTSGTITEMTASVDNTPVTLKSDGIANASQINNSLHGIEGTRTQLIVESNFADYGRAVIHVTNADDNDPEINQVLVIETGDAITLTADAPLSISMSLGSAYVSTAFIQSDLTQTVLVFFGNTETRLSIEKSGNPCPITNVTGAANTINNDGSAIITFPDLKKETDTAVQVTFTVGATSYTRTVIIKRTALLSNYDGREGVETLSVGYVVNTNYLYNNQAHDPTIFDATLVAILYEGNKISEVQQYEIDDADLVNALVNHTPYHDNPLGDTDSFAIEYYDSNAIRINLSKKPNITNVKLFLTNGKYDINGNLPSIEYGVGAGLDIEVGGE